jgi:group II intron reverse transcriptase/maturase
MSLTTPEKIRKLQRTFYAKAKDQPSYRFHQLYDKVYREDILAYAYRRCKANAGAAGVDGQTFEMIEEYGRDRWLGELAEKLRKKGYRPGAIRRVWIEKANGGQRPLGIATIQDRVVQMAIVLVIEPIFEADLEAEQYGYRPKRSAQDAIRAVENLLDRGHREVIDADLSGYFDTIPHAELIQCVARRISDSEMLGLIKRFLKAPVQDRRDGGRPGNKPSPDQGTPQGSPLSPLLANLYFRRFILGWKKLGLMERYQAHIVNYADDFVICCRTGAQAALQWTRQIMGKLKLEINESKTQIHRVPDENLDFLGYTIGWCRSKKTGKNYIGARPSKKRISESVEISAP